MQVQGRCIAFAHAAAGDRGQAGVEHHPQRRHEVLAGRSIGMFEAHGQLRIVGEHGAGAGQDRAAARTPAMHVVARGFAADPLGIAGGHRGAAIQAHRQLDPQPRPPAFHPRQEAAVQLARLRFHQAGADFDPGRAQLVEAGAIDLRERIAHCPDYPRDTRRDQRIRARPGAAGMRARLQGHVGGRAFRTLAGRLQREHFRMRPALALVPAFADDRVAMREHTADHRVRSGGERAALGQPQRARHHPVVDRTEGHFLRFLSMETTSPPSNDNWPSPGRSRSSRSSSSRKSATSSKLR